MTLPLSDSPAGSPVAAMVEPRPAVSVATNGRPTVPLGAVEVRTGSVHELTVIATGALSPQPFCAATSNVPAARGVPVMRLPASVRPEGRGDFRTTVAPRDGMNVVVNGSPTVARRLVAVSVGAEQAATPRASVARDPHAFVTVIVALPASVGVPDTTLPLRDRPAGRLAAVSVVPRGATIVETNGTPTEPVVRLALTTGAGHGSHDDSASIW